jgi:hypothetical protein
MEDLDLCFRLREAGWVTWYEPSVTVWHVKAGTSGPIRSARLNRAFHYGMLRFYRKHYAPRHGPLRNAAVYGGIGAKLAVSLVRARVRTSVSTATPRHALATHARRSAGRTRAGEALKRLLRGPTALATYEVPDPWTAAGETAPVPSGIRVTRIAPRAPAPGEGDVVCVADADLPETALAALLPHALAAGVGVVAPAGASFALIAHDRFEELSGLSPLYATAPAAVADLAQRARAAGYRNVRLAGVAIPAAPAADPLDEALLEDRWGAPA